MSEYYVRWWCTFERQYVVNNDVGIVGNFRNLNSSSSRYCMAWHRRISQMSHECQLVPDTSGRLRSLNMFTCVLWTMTRVGDKTVRCC